jgi:hypothetical protein
MTAAVESKNRRDRGWLSVKTCSSASEVQDVLAEMCNGAMLTGLDCISDGEEVITTGMVWRLACSKCSNAPTTSSRSVLSDYEYCRQQCMDRPHTPHSLGRLTDVQYTSNMPHAPHVDTDTGECIQC